jgi:uncharacterized protein (DUF1499 family)
MGWLAALGPGYKSGLWGFRAAFSTFPYLVGVGALVGLAGVVLALRRRGDRKAVLACLVGAGLAGLAALFPLHMRRAAASLPFIHDISTDLTDPPRFNLAVDWRGPEANPLDRADPPDLAEQQRRGYPDLGGVELKATPAVALVAAAEVARSLGWDPVRVDPAMGTIEATETTRWWGFRDDVVVRVRETKDGSLVDVRSVSRVGKSDLGLNAMRIRRFLARLAERVAGG